MQGRWSERLFLLFLLALFAGAGWKAEEFPVEAQRLPRLLFIVGAGLIAAIFLREFFRPSTNPLGTRPRERNRLRFWLCLGLTCVYIGVMFTELAGFLSASFAFIFTLGAILGGAQRMRPAAILLASSLGVPLALYVVFKVILEVPLPVGAFLP